MSATFENCFEICYENDSASSFMVLTLDSGIKILDYQLEMIANNPNHSIMPVSLRRKDNQIKLYYNITSKQSLSQLLHRRSLGRGEIIKLIKNISRILLTSRNFFLTGNNFLLKEEFIYVNPSSINLSLVYIPAETGLDCVNNFKELVRNLLSNMEDSDDSGIFREIISFIETDDFSISGLDKLLAGQSSISYKTSNEAEGFCEEKVIDITQNSKISIPPAKAGVEMKREMSGEKPLEEPSELRYKTNSILIGVLSQILILIALILIYRVVLLPSGADVSSVLGLVLTSGAADFLLLKKLFNKENMEIVTPGTGKQEKRRIEEKTSFFDESTSVSPPTEIIDDPGTQETIILRSGEEVQPYLVSCQEDIRDKIIINKPHFIIGRLKGHADYILKNNAVGKIHAELTVSNGTFIVKDLNSRNGTYVNGKKIVSNVEHEIRNRDRVAFANSEYTFMED